MKILAILGKINPLNARKTATNAAKKDKTLAEQVLEDRRTVLKGYLSNPDLNADNTVKKINKERLMSATVNSLMIELGDNLNQIKDMLGEYGLAKYGEVDPASIIEPRNGNITEFGYLSDKPVKNTFYNYLLLNDTGVEEGISKRFGRCGEILFEECKKSGLVMTGSNNSYHIPAERKHYIALTALEEKQEGYSLYGSGESFRYFRY